MPASPRLPFVTATFPYVRKSPRLLASCLSFSVGLSLCAAGVVLPTRQALAAPPEDSTEAKLAEAKTLYEQGKAKFDTAEYNEALVLWKKAYGLLTESPDTNEIRNALVYNISEAEIKAYEVDRDPSHLRKAKALLTDYVKTHTALYGEERADERTQATDRLVEVEQMLEASAALGEGSGSNTTEPEGPSPTPAPVAMTAAEREKAARVNRRNEISTTPELSAQESSATKKIVTGAVLLGVGGGTALVGLAVVGVGLPTPGDFFTEPTPPSIPALAIGGVLIAAGLGVAIAGAVILPKGLKTRRDVRAPRPHNYPDDPAAAAATAEEAPRSEGENTASGEEAPTEEAAPAQEAPPAEEAPAAMSRLDLRERPKPRWVVAPYATTTGGGLGMLVQF